MKLNASLTGDVELEKKLLSLASAVAWKQQRDALMIGAEPIRSEMSLRAPFDATQSGDHLRDHIIIDALTEGEVRKGVEHVEGTAVVEVGPNIPHFYGYFSEYGTVKEPARPWARPAFDSRSGQALRLTLSTLWNSIRTFVSGSGGGVGSRNL